MAWLEVSIRVKREQAERVSEEMEAQRSLAVTLVGGAGDQAAPPGLGGEVLEPPAGAPGSESGAGMPLWAEVELRGLFEDKVNRAEVIQALLKVPGIDRPEQLRWRRLEDRAWERAWMDHITPMRFGRRLWIVPGGMHAPDPDPGPAPDPDPGQAPRDPRALIIHLDPGLAFGTGAHPTTALCLQWLDRAKLADSVVVDYGCGSGVLAIAAALKGARRVVAVDNDPQALEACEANARSNGMQGRIVSCLPDHFHAVLRDALRGQEGADAVLSNILARPLVELAPLLTGSLRPGGKLVLSGLLESQAGEVASAYRGSCGKMAVRKLDGWVRLSGTLRKARTA